MAKVQLNDPCQKRIIIFYNRHEHCLLILLRQSDFHMVAVCTACLYRRLPHTATKWRDCKCEKYLLYLCLSYSPFGRLSIQQPFTYFMNVYKWHHLMLLSYACFKLNGTNCHTKFAYTEFISIKHYISPSAHRLQSLLTFNTKAILRHCVVYVLAGRKAGMIILRWQFCCQANNFKNARLIVSAVKNKLRKF